MINTTLIQRIEARAVRLLGTANMDGHVKDWIEDVLEVLESQRWISCAERLPKIPEGEECFDCLLCFDDGGVREGFFDGEDFAVNQDLVEPIAWMPLPAPYDFLSPTEEEE